MKNKKGIIAAVVIIVIGFGGFFGYNNFFKASAEEVEAEVQTFDVTVMQLTETYSTSGNISSKVDEEIVAPIASDLYTSNIEVGDVIAVGDVIGTLDDSGIKIEVLNQEKTILSLQADISELKSSGTTSYAVSIENARIAYEDAKSTYEKNVSLFSSGAVSQSEVNSAKDAMDKALNSYNLEKNKYSSYDYSAQLELLEKSLEIEQLELEALLEDYEGVTVTSDYAGTVVDIYVESGDSVSEGQSILRVMDMTSLEIITDVSEYEIMDLEEGQMVIIQALGDDSLVGRGEITTISPNAEVDGTDVVVSITIDITDGADNFKPGYSTDLTVMVAQSDSAMVVPYDALVTLPKGYAVTKLVGEEEVSVVVETGIESDLMVEIISDDIAEGDTVIVYSAIDYTNQAAGGGLMIPGMGGGMGGGNRPDGGGKSRN